MSRALRRNLPEPVFIGFQARERYPALGHWWWEEEWAKHVREFCNLSEHFASLPEDWVSRWDFNCACCWNSEEAAWAPVPDRARDGYCIYAYRALPVLFAARGAPLAMPLEEVFVQTVSFGAPPPEPDLSRFARLGYDVAQHDRSMNIMPWQCSPLACNGMAEHYPVNHWCLIDAIADAYRAAVGCARQQPEPGDYLIVEVLRREDGKA